MITTSTSTKVIEVRPQQTIESQARANRDDLKYGGLLLLPGSHFYNCDPRPTFVFHTTHTTASTSFVNLGLLMR